MKAKIHKEMAYQVIIDYPEPQLAEFLIKGVAKPDWNKDRVTRIRWVKEWMDMPDDKKHSSKLSNDHSYKIAKKGNSYTVQFNQGNAEQATVVARLKYAVRDMREWRVEEEPRICALELLKSIHWVVDMSSPSHTIVGWDDRLHSKVETDFDAVWTKFYDKKSIEFKRSTDMEDIYRWARAFIVSKYDRNEKLLNLYKLGGSIRSGDGAALGREIITDIGQNLADYFGYCDKMLNYNKLQAELPG